MESSFDAIIIGSGLGGLTSGAFLARAGMKVLVLEKHNKLGGYAHAFRRKKHIFESGIHSVPLAETGTIRHLLRLLGVDDQIQTVELNEMYRLLTPAFSFTMPTRREEIDAALHSLGRNGSVRLDKLHREWDLVTHNVINPVKKFEESFREEDRSFVSRYHNVSYNRIIHNLIDNDFVRRALFGQWPYAGISPENAGALFCTVMFLLHYHEGTHTLNGGFGTLVDALAHAIVSRGGEIRTRCEVNRLITEKRIVKAVRTTAGEEFETPVVVSNVSPYLLHGSMLDEGGRSKLTKRRLSNLSPSLSSVIVYLGLRPNCPKPIEHNTVFWFDTNNFDEVYQKALTRRPTRLDHLIMLSSTPRATDQSTLTLMHFAHASCSPDWHDDKRRLADKMIQKAEELYPGIKELVETTEIGSPNTFVRYTGNTDGALYGFENTYAMYGEAKLPIRTHLKNLYQVGHWGKPGGGVVNVMTNGYTGYHVIMEDMRGPSEMGKRPA
ncbi:MAG: FAD-dependent oxidoreductase [Chitinivibrionales bacterium]|nr:FAD-dependent oxidoreductase [Chitinivibrionales bacterium]MBD3358205.1 FAD-dependent oxidoreductase [Chitinivibrionales bacterium]